MVSKQTAPASHHSPQQGADDAEQKASSKAKMRWWEGVLISYCSSSSVFLPGNNNTEIPAPLSQESSQSGEERRRHCELLHIKPRSISLRLPSPYLSPSPSSCLQQQVQGKSTDPPSNNPRGTCSAFSEITASEKNYLLRAAVGSTNTFSSPQLWQKEAVWYLPEVVSSYPGVNVRARPRMLLNQRRIH